MRAHFLTPRGAPGVRGRGVPRPSAGRAVSAPSPVLPGARASAAAPAPALSGGLRGGSPRLGHTGPGRGQRRTPEDHAGAPFLAGLGRGPTSRSGQCHSAPGPPLTPCARGEAGRTHVSVGSSCPQRAPRSAAEPAGPPTSIYCPPRPGDFNQTSRPKVTPGYAEKPLGLPVSCS